MLVIQKGQGGFREEDVAARTAWKFRVSVWDLDMCYRYMLIGN